MEELKLAPGLTLHAVASLGEVVVVMPFILTAHFMIVTVAALVRFSQFAMHRNIRNIQMGWQGVLKAQQTLQRWKNAGRQDCNSEET